MIDLNEEEWVELKAIEENRQDSEFELIELDDILRHSAGYKDFIRSLCSKRLEINGYEIKIELILLIILR